MMQMDKQQHQQLIQSIAIIDIDTTLTLYKPSCNQQKWVSSLELYTQMPKENKNNSKIVLLTQGLYLQINYCQKNRPPIFQIDFVSPPTFEWIALKMPNSFVEKYGTLTLCYKTQDNNLGEPLTDIQMLITERKRMGEDKQIFILPSGYKIINNNPIAHSYLIYKRMKSLFQQTFKPILLEKYPEENKINQALLPIFCFPEGIHLSKELKGFISFNFILTQENGDRIYANCLSFKQSLDESIKNKLNLNTSDKIYYEKAICLLSKHRYTDEFSQCLKHLYRLSMSKNDTPFHKVILSFVSNMLLPKEIGTNGLSYSYGGSNINFDTNHTYPIISERAIYCIFKFLPLQAIISIFEAVLLEKKIIFVSQSKTILGFAIEGFLSFVFPFRWEHVLIPILPSTLKEYMTAPVPLIVGIHPSMMDHTIESDSVIVQMDNGTILNDEDLPPLPDKLQKQLRKRLEMFELYDENDVKEYLQNPQSTYIFKMQEVQHPEFQGCIIRDSFYQFMLTFMKNYRKFWKIQKYKDNKENSTLSLTEPQLLNDIFKVQDFLSDLGMSKVGSFGYKFTEGTIFTSFIQRKHQYSEDFQLRFFDDCLQKKKSNKNAKLIEKITNIRYIVAKHPQPQAIKTYYVYQKFPSILGKQIIKQQQIILNLQSIDEDELQCLQQFLQEQFKVNHKLFQQSSSEDIDYKIQSLLLLKYKNIYYDFKQKIDHNAKVDIYKSTISSNKIRNNRVIYDKLAFFQKIYFQQMDTIQRLFEEWPYQSNQLINIHQVQKHQYLKFNLKSSSQPLNDNELYCIYEEYYGSKYRNYQTMIKNNTKIIFLDNMQSKGNIMKQNLRSSRKKLKYVYQVYIEHFKIKNFINKVIPVHSHSLFTFIFEKIQRENINVWNMDVLIEWREYLLLKLSPNK